MQYYTYIIYSQTHDILYKGYTLKPLIRLEQHNNGESRYTKCKGPWKLVFLKSHQSESEARKYERNLKRQNRNYLIWLIQSNRNELDDFLNSY